MLAAHTLQNILTVAFCFAEIFPSAFCFYNSDTSYFDLKKNIITHPPYTECTGLSGSPGICLRAFACAQLGGIPSGYCSVPGICCIVSLKCGGASSAKKSLIEGSVAPIPSQTHCSYAINSYSNRVCQLKVEFDTNLPQPTVVLSNSPPDSLKSCGSYLSINRWQICGVNAKQHVYVNFGNTSIVETISILIAPYNSADWNMVVTQLECPPNQRENVFSFPYKSTNRILDLQKLMRVSNYDTDLLAPNGCLQYFPNATGAFESFNYNNGLGPFMPNMQYAICFKRSYFASSLQFAAERFQMSYNKDMSADFEMVDQSCYDEQGLTQIHANDFLLIPYSTISQDQIKGTRYCGSILENKNLVATMPGPFAVIVSTGTMYQPAYQTRGPRAFKLSYSIA